MQVSPKFIRTNQSLKKIASIIKSFFVAETGICVTYIPNGVTSSPSLSSQELFGQYWESGVRMIQYYITVVFVRVGFFFRKKIQLILSEVMKLLQVGHDALENTNIRKFHQ